MSCKGPPVLLILQMSFSAGLRSECLKQARIEISAHLTEYLTKNNISKEEGQSAADTRNLEIIATSFGHVKAPVEHTVIHMYDPFPCCSECDGGNNL